METALVTGATSGIGLATARLLADQGYQVFGTTRSLKKRAPLIAQIQTAYGQRIQFIPLDTTQETSVKAAVQTVIQQAGRVDILVCNAGSGIYGSIEEMPMIKVQEQFDTNVFGTLRTLQAVVPHMREQRSGRVVLVSSMAGLVAIPFQAHYSATKYAIEAFTEGLRQELRGFGIKVAAVRPGDIQTEFNEVTGRFLPNDSPYKKWSEACWKVIDKNMQVAPPPALVAKKILKMIRSRNPKTYYSAADPLTTLLPILSRFMSSRLKEKVIRLFYGVDFR